MNDGAVSYEDFSKDYRKDIRRKKTLIIGISVLAFIAGMLEIALGPYKIGFIEAYQVFFNHLIGNPVANRIDDYVIWNINAPRALAVVFVGAGLGICGVAMQSALKNPLADPYMTGISAGANMGVSLAMVLGIFIVPFASGNFGLIANAFIFALMPATAIVVVSSFKRHAGPTTMILIGIAIMYVFSSFTTMVKLVASDESYAEVFSWALGTLGSANWENLPIIIGATIGGILLLSAMSVKLNLLALNENLTISSGLNPKRTRIVVIALSSLVTAVLVCFTGTIGFIGLVAPHIMRIFLGSDNRYLLPASAAAGAFILAVADCIAIELTSTGLPVGVITSLIGGPLFIYILINQHRRVWT